MTVYLIRHGQTQWNAEDRFLGLTDIPLNDAGMAAARAAAGSAPKPELIFRSPLLRCGQTAEIFFPGRESTILYDLRECDFGSFEGRCTTELERDTEYRRWIASRCEAPIPGGERVTDFHDRCCNAVEHAIRANPNAASIAFVAHGGVIMSLLSRFNVEHHDFYDYHIENCAIITCSCNLDGALALKVISGKCL